VVVRLVKGRKLVRDVHAMVRLEDRLWHWQCADVGPRQAEVRVTARYADESDLPDLQLPRRPFMLNGRNRTLLPNGRNGLYRGEGAAVVSWLHNGRRHWAGHLLERERARIWRQAGPTLRGSRSLLEWEWERVPWVDRDRNADREMHVLAHPTVGAGVAVDGLERLAADDVEEAPEALPRRAGARQALALA